MSRQQQAPPGYRPCVGILLLNAAGQIFVGERLDTPDAWQMPQGGIDPGEDALAAATRELREETGIDSAELIELDEDWQTYDLPPEIGNRAWGGRYRGQAQIWAAFRFTGEDSEIDIATADPEFRQWKWTDADTLVDEIVEFKRDIYRRVLSRFRAYLARGPSGT